MRSHRWLGSSIKSVASKATQQSPTVGNANQICKCSAKLVSQNAKKEFNILSFDVPTNGDSISCSVCLESSTQHEIWGRKACVLSLMEVGSRLKQQGTRVANIICSTQRSWHGCVGRRSSKRTIPTTTLQKPSMKGLAAMDVEDGKACSTQVGGAPLS